MNTKDVIETLKTFDKDTNYEDADFYNEVIELLKQGEADSKELLTICKIVAKQISQRIIRK